jgi:transposase InsO family protein
VPSHPTIGNILKRHDCEVIKNNKSNPAKKRFEREQANELWQMDFKGSFMTKAHRCYPLTILDDHSRFSIGLKACKNETGATVKMHLTKVFEVFGLPEQINVDNGNPWGSSDLDSLTSLNVWLIKLGIKLTHSSPFHPQTNGKDERFHRSLKLEILHQREYKNEDDIQKAFDTWQHIYNYKRPHQGINNEIPSSRYQVSRRKFSDKLPEYNYGSDEIVRKVSDKTGLFRFKGKRYRAGKALSNEHIAIKETEQTNRFAIYLMDKFIKQFSLQEFI